MHVFRRHRNVCVRLLHCHACISTLCTAYTPHLISIDQMFSICHYLNLTEPFLCVLCRRAAIFVAWKPFTFAMLMLNACEYHIVSNALTHIREWASWLAGWRWYAYSMDGITQYAVSCTCQFFNHCRYLHTTQSLWASWLFWDSLVWGFVSCVGGHCEKALQFLLYKNVLGTYITKKTITCTMYTPPWKMGKA